MATGIPTNMKITTSEGKPSEGAQVSEQGNDGAAIDQRQVAKTLYRKRN